MNWRVSDTFVWKVDSDEISSDAFINADRLGRRAFNNGSGNGAGGSSNVGGVSKRTRPISPKRSNIILQAASLAI